MQRRDQNKSNGGGSISSGFSTAPAPERGGSKSDAIQSPQIALPKGGGAIRGMGEKFQVNPVTGTGSLSIPIAMSPGRSGFTPQLTLSYDSGSGNSPFGMGWGVGLPSISRKTQKGLPRYEDNQESDIFLISGAEDLVPVLNDTLPTTADIFTIKRYRPRIEGLFARIEKWTRNDGATFWKSITKENITTIYGQSENAQIYHPEDKGKPGKRVFQWLIERTFDDKCNIIRYEYKPENGANISASLHEKNRQPGAEVYLKRVLYGNTKPYVSGGINPLHTEPEWAAWSAQNQWLFELVFDYGDQAVDAEGTPRYDLSATDWPCRPDPFSSFRSGFDIRTYRLCRRILMFHHFKELGEENYLVRSTDLRHDENPIATKLLAAAHTSYRKKADAEGYDKAGMPEVVFKYTEIEPDFEVKEIGPPYSDNLPQGIDGQQFHWVDLYGEGVGGLLSQSDNAWYYKPNLGDGRFGALEQVAEMPALADLNQPGQQLVDLGGDGQLNLVIQSRALNGYYEIDDAGHWKTFQAFESIPNRNLGDPNLRLLDLCGDGHADILITEDDCFVWQRSRGEAGFEAAQRVAKAMDEDHGPRIVFADSTQSIYLSDVNGDGLTDILRIRNGEVCYWPNLGYGRFGAKIAMDNAPWFDYPDQFDQRRIRLADIDGSGTTDIFYLGTNVIRYWHNQSGNSWDETPHEITQFPKIDNLSDVSVLDLKGKGTAQLVWSSPLPADAGAPLRYIDLMPQKPHLLVEVNNNLGSVTKLQYQPSTDFYLADKAAGTPWITRIPYPVYVLTRQEIHDAISDNHFVTRYAYHHGYFDGEEQEFRGFGLIEQWDTEDFAGIQKDEVYAPKGTNWSEETDVPPVYTKTWFHSGFFYDRERISRLYAEEYYQLDPDSWLLYDTVLPPDLTAEEEREACRALKGSMLRQEVYAEDESDKAKHPYTVTEVNYRIQCLQKEGANRYAVFLVTPGENLAYHYEREAGDPRIAHTLNLETDRYGNTTHALAIVYPRRGENHPEEQKRLYATLTENRLIHPDGHSDWYRHSLPLSTRSFELHGLETRFAGEKFGLDGAEGLKALVGSFYKEENGVYIYPPEVNLNKVLDHAEQPTAGTIQLRLLTENRIKYTGDDLTTILPFGEVESLAIPYETYTLAFTDPILKQPELKGFITPELLAEGGYKTSQELFGANELRWWIPSGTSIFESEAAPAMFYLPRGVRDPFGSETRLWYDRDAATGKENGYYLLMTETRDALDNTILADNDYRLLQPRQVTDPNDNKTRAAFDIRGMVMATAVLGKGTEGDELAAFQELHCNETSGYFDTILANPALHLGHATTWFHYDVFAWMREKQPPFAIGLSRETHYHQLGGETSPVQIAVTYSDGFGREILTKVQAEDGDAPHYDAEGKIILNDDGKPELAPCTDRWVGNGRTIFNNKGKPVKQYEPFFDSNARFTDEAALVYAGVTPVIHYDPLMRVIRTDFPDGTFSRVEFSPWDQIIWDQNDTVLDPACRWYQEHIQLPDERDPEKIAAKKAATNAATPAIQHLDTLGRPFVSIAHNRYWEHYKNAKSEVNVFIPTHTFADIEGNPPEIWDGRRCERLSSADAALEYNRRGQTASESTGNRVMTYRYALGGLQLYQDSMDAGPRWGLVNVLGNPTHSWDARGHHHFTTYDALQRPTQLWVEHEGAVLLPEYLVYGETAPQAAAHNLRGQLFLHFDGAGAVAGPSFDFKGNPLESKRRLAAVDYQAKQDAQHWKEVVPDWQAYQDQNAANLVHIVQGEPATGLEDRVYSTAAAFDALNRPVKSVTPDHSATYPLYNKANLLEAVKVNLKGNAAVPDETPDGIRNNAGLNTFVKNIDYNAKGQRERIEYGNGANTAYTYDENTFRLIRLKTTRSSQGANGAARETALQDIHYTYDPVGNITEIYDEAQPTIFRDNQKVELRNQYTYDALYQLICATGRESRANAYGRDHEDIPILDHIPISDTEVRNYRQHYRYDPAGNILTMRHIAKGGSWTRLYDYETYNNRLTATHKNNHRAYHDLYPFDEHGSMTAMPHLERLTWDYKDQLVHTKRNGDGELFFTYDSARQRVRKLFFGVRERIYLGAYEWCTEPGSKRLDTLHIMDDRQRICMVETPEDGQSRYRYQLANHLGSAAIELDENAEVITYEEYHPYGTSAFRAQYGAIGVSAKRYRYTGMERDEETGLAYHTARYYLGWLGRWGSCDKKGISSNLNHFIYCNANPICFTDLFGEDCHPWDYPPCSIIYYPKDPKLNKLLHDLESGKLEYPFDIQANIILEKYYNDLRYWHEHGRPPIEEKHELKEYKKSEGDLFDNVNEIIDNVEQTFESGSTSDKVYVTATGLGAAASLSCGYYGDYGALLGSIVAFGAKPSYEGFEDIIYDAFGALLPLMTASGTLRRAERLQDEVDALKGVNKVERLPPGPKPPPQITRPTGKMPYSPHDASALENFGMSARWQRYRRYDEDHHLFVEEFREWFEHPDRGFNIDDFTVTMTWGEHSATHLGWNSTWAEFIENNPNASALEVLDQLEKMKKDYLLDNLPVHPYRK